MENNTMGFLPDDYTVPESGNYMKLKDGANVFRIMGSAVIGWEWWSESENGKEGHRSREYPQQTPGIKIDKEGKAEKPKHFWAFVVWNYAGKRLQILSVTQQSIQNGIKALADNKQWGHPKSYDITITRAGQGFETEYTVMPNPHTELNADITTVFEEAQIDLNALFAGADPFDPNWKEETTVQAE